MFVSNGIKTNIRSRGRTALFFALIFMLTLVMTAAAGVRDYCLTTIKKCDGEFRSVALVEYLGSEYPDPDEPDDYARQALSDLDLSSLGAIPGVKSVTVPRHGAYYFDGFRQSRRNPLYRDYGVVVVTNFGREQTFSQTETWYSHVPADEVKPDDVVEYYYTADGSEYTDEEQGEQYALVAHTEVKETVYYSAIINYPLFSGSGESNIKINFLPGDSGFEPERDKRYVVHGVFLGRTSLFAPSNGLDSFIVTSIEGSDGLPWAEYDSPESIPERFDHAAARYTYANNFVFAEFAADVRDIYVFHQGELYLQEGGFPDPSEEGGCVITADLAQELEVGIGDTITGQKMTTGEESVYELTLTDRYDSFTVRGIVKNTNDYTGRIWAVGESGEDPFFGYTLATVSLENEHAEDAVDAIRGMLPPLTQASLLDQGYGDTVKPFRSIATVATDIIFVCAAGTLAALLLFAFVFVGRQSYSVKIMVSLGTPRRKIALWLLSGATAISGTAALLGGAVGWIALPVIFRIISSGVGGADSSLRPYSELSLGVTHSVKVGTSFSPVPVIVCVTAVILTSLLFCAVFMRIAYRGSAPKKGKTRVRVPAGRTSTALSGSLRFSALSIRRGGRRSVIVPAVCAALTAVIVLLSGVFSGWQEKLDVAYDNTVITGHAVSTSGRFYSDLLIPIDNIREINRTEGVGDVFVSMNFKYFIETEMPPFADNSFGRERKESWKRTGAEVISLNDMRAAKDFFYSDPSITWADGWDESFLAEYECPLIVDGSTAFNREDNIPAIFSDSFMEQRSLSPGDVFSVTILVEKIYFNSEVPLTFEIVGSYKQVGKDANIYIPLSCTIPSDAFDEKFDPSALDHPGAGPSSFMYNWNNYTDYYVYKQSTLSTCRFTVSSAHSLETLRKALEEKDFTRVGGKTGTIRTTIVLEDASFVTLTETLGRYISMGRAMAVLICAIVTLIGFIVSWLMINGRKREFALMRGFGARGGRIFASFFFEQAILCVIGCAVGCLMMIFTGAGALKLLAVGGFILFYLAGCAVSTAVIGKTKLMELFADSE